MAIEHKKEFGIYHWDTFDNETFLKHEEDTAKSCEHWIIDNYGDSLHGDGADRVEIINQKGEIVKKWNVR